MSEKSRQGYRKSSKPTQRPRARITRKDNLRRTIFCSLSSSDSSRGNQIKGPGEVQPSICAREPKVHLLATRPWDNTSLWSRSLGEPLKDRNSKASFSMKSTKIPDLPQKRTWGQPNWRKPTIPRWDVSRKISRNECLYRKWERKRGQLISLILPLSTQRNLTISIFPGVAQGTAPEPTSLAWTTDEIRILRSEQPRWPGTISSSSKRHSSRSSTWLEKRRTRGISCLIWRALHPSLSNIWLTRKSLEGRSHRYHRGVVRLATAEVPPNQPRERRSKYRTIWSRRRCSRWPWQRMWMTAKIIGPPTYQCSSPSSRRCRRRPQMGLITRSKCTLLTFTHLQSATMMTCRPPFWWDDSSKMTRTTSSTILREILIRIKCARYLRKSTSWKRISHQSAIMLKVDFSKE